MHANLNLDNLKLEVNLGVSELERRNKQTIRVNIHIAFDQSPNAIHTDQINDTLCYDHLCQALTKVAATKQYALIEHLAHDLLNLVRSKLRANDSCGVTIIKNPPIDTLNQVQFSLTAKGLITASTEVIA